MTEKNGKNEFTSAQRAAPIPKDSWIAIVGAGPGGLSAAYYLKKHGYTNVDVLEKLGRVGGLCQSITEDGASFDLGANFVTPAYKRVLRLAREHEVKLYPEVDGGVLQYLPTENRYEPISVWDAVRGKSVAESKPPRSRWEYIKDCVRYCRERWKIRKIVDAPGFAKIEAEKELCVPFHEWLTAKNLDGLIPLFEIPITVMGYGYVKCPDCTSPEQSAAKEISAPYALKYMTLCTFIPMAMKFSPFMKLIRWPKRFELGFQRFWEAIATRLDVSLNIDIREITRRDGKVIVKFTQDQQSGNTLEPSCEITKTYDYLILTCPLSLDVLGRKTTDERTMLDLSNEEKGLFKKILTHSYALAAFSIKKWPPKWPRILCTIPLTNESWPWAITRQFEHSETTQFYLQLSEHSSDYRDKQTRDCDCTEEPTEPGGPFVHSMPAPNAHLPTGVSEFIKHANMEIDFNDLFTYDHWPYFQHVTVSEMRDNKFYTKLENLQGVRNTFYGGSLMNFELVENVMAYSEYLVREYFVGGKPSRQETGPVSTPTSDDGAPEAAAQDSRPPGHTRTTPAMK